MDRRAAFLEKLRQELDKINIESFEDTGENSESEVFIEDNLNLDYGETRESAAENLALTCTDIDAAEGFEDGVLVSRMKSRSPPEVTDRECVVPSCAPDNDGRRTQILSSRVEDGSKRPRARDAEESRETNGSPPAKIPKTVGTGFDAEESAQDSEFCTNERSKSPAAQEDEVGSDVTDEALEDIQEEDVSADSDFEEESKEELMTLLLPEEKNELETLSEVSQMYCKLIEARVKELNSKLRKEVDAHCRYIKQKAVDEMAIFKRPSLVVVGEYQRTILVAMKYLEKQLKKVSSYESSALKWVVDDFKKKEREVFGKVKERKQLRLENRAVRKRRYPIHPLVFYITFVMIMTMYSSFVLHIQRINGETS